MKCIDYRCYYRRAVRPDRICDEVPICDVFISAYNSSDRVLETFERVRARRKVWLVHPEYQFASIELPTQHEVVQPDKVDEIAQVRALLDRLGGVDNKSICVDITGFMRHVLAFLVVRLAREACPRFLALYSEPDFYKRQERTEFSTLTSGMPRPVRGMATGSDPGAKDHLILLVGFDHALISEVVNQKDGAKVFPVFAFPPLSADMYQQSALRAAESGEVALEDDWHVNRRFAPANDPFATAEVLSNITSDIVRSDPAANIYLAPLSTKVQTLGAAIFWELEARHRQGMCILMPQALRYSRGTTEGLSRTWLFDVELVV
jgi:hypothetical protein